MRIFSIKENGKFEEFSQTHFHVDHEESVLENWLESEIRVRTDKWVFTTTKMPNCKENSVTSGKAGGLFVNRS